MIIDAHLHCSGQESGDQVLRSLDEAEVDVGVLLAPLFGSRYSRNHRDSVRAANAWLGELVRAAPDRMVGFAVVNPLHAEAVDDLTEAVERHLLRGLKLVPSGWYPYDDCALRVYERASALDLPVLFHSGIFIDGRSGRFCRPVFYEAIRDFPRLHAVLAHLGWPWCDEANAVGVIDLINGVPPPESQFRFDISFGPPPVYRQAVLSNALAVLGPQLLQFGSDRFLPCEGCHIKKAIRDVVAIFDALEVSREAREHIMGTTAARWLRLSS